MLAASTLAALGVVSLAAAHHTGDRWEGTWRVAAGAFASTLVLRPASDTATRAQAPSCTGQRRLYTGSYSGGRAGTIAACTTGSALDGRLYENGKRIGEISIVWALAVSPDGTLGAPSFSGAYTIGARRRLSGTWLRHGGSIPTTKRPQTGLTAQQAAARVEAILRRNRARCELTWTTVVARRAGRGWRVTASVRTFGNPGNAAWNVVGTRVSAAEPLAAEIEAGCP
jgi:hypothetical protein